MAFSGALTLTDLNDFITPSQACIKPVEQTNPSTNKDDPGAASTEIRVDTNGVYYEVSGSGAVQNDDSKTSVPAKKLEQAQISLNDCLACSGCITSAESVLVTMQSHTEVLNFLRENGDSASSSYRIPVLSIAPQCLASLAASLSSSSTVAVTPRQVLSRVQVFCREVLRFAHVFDTTFARHLVLEEHVNEFMERKAKDSEGGEAAEGQLPMLASACPGWICYAEKAHSEMLPFIARTKSPQQVMGTLVKEWMATKWRKTPQEVYHVTVMPCYDKKLEASRQDFYNELYSTRDVDCVITTGELELMMREHEWDLSLSRPNEQETGLTDIETSFPELVQHPGTSSGSYLHSIMSHLTNTSPNPLTLSVKMIRNTDYEEYTLSEEDGFTGEQKVIFKGAKCYGFRNLQNVVRKVGKERGVQVGAGAAGKMSTRPATGRRIRKSAVEGKAKDRNYDYIEVMACPGGCVNGGGQLKPPKLDAEGYTRDWEESGIMEEGQAMSWGNREWIKKVEEAYWNDSTTSIQELPTPPPSPSNETNGSHKEDDTHAVRVLEKSSRLALASINELASAILEQLCNGTSAQQEARRKELFRTQYRVVESEVIGLAVKW